jgi:hypothetical protein
VLVDAALLRPDQHEVENGYKQDKKDQVAGR